MSKLPILFLYIYGKITDKRFSLVQTTQGMQLRKLSMMKSTRTSSKTRPASQQSQKEHGAPLKKTHHGEVVSAATVPQNFS